MNLKTFLKNNILLFILFFVIIVYIITNLYNPIKENYISNNNFYDYGIIAPSGISSIPGSTLKNEPLLKKLITYIPEEILYINQKNDEYSYNINKLNDYNNSIILKTEEKDNLSGSLRYTDVVTFNENYKNNKVLTICNSPKLFILFSKNKKNEEPNINLINTKKDLNNKTNEDISSSMISPKNSSIEVEKIGLNIGYINDIELNIFKKIVKSQKDFMNMNNYSFIKLKRDEILSGLFSDNALIDIFIYYNTIEHPLLDELQKNNYNLVSYDKLDTHLYKFYFPFANKQILQFSVNKDSNKVVKNTKNGVKLKGQIETDNSLITYNTLIFDCLLFVERGNENIILKKYKNHYNYLLEYFNEFLKINYYMQHFNFLELSKKWSNIKQNDSSFKNVMDIQNKVSKSQNIANMNLKELFTNKNEIMRFKTYENHIIAINKKEKNVDIIQYKLLGNQYKINGIPLKVGDKLYTESGVGNFYKKRIYYIIKIYETKERGKRKNNVILEDGYRFKIRKEIWDNREIRDGYYLLYLTGNDIRENNFENGDRLYLTRNDKKMPKIDKIGNIIEKETEDESIENEKNKYEYSTEIKKDKIVSLIIKVIDLSVNKKGNKNIKDNNAFDPKYRCYQDQSILTKVECEDAYDASDNPKPRYNWDKPCVRNADCPFYLSNKNYLNERGGCNNGYCELPVGIKRKSWREYDKEYREDNYPRCYGCLKDEIDCCEKQENGKLKRKDKSNYKSADYAFMNDNEDRRLSKFN
jgi:hypothetical protein